MEPYYPTIEGTYSKSINYQGVDYDCDIIDTAGQVRPRIPAIILLTSVLILLPPPRTNSQS